MIELIGDPYTLIDEIVKLFKVDDDRRGGVSVDELQLLEDDARTGLLEPERVIGLVNETRRLIAEHEALVDLLNDPSLLRFHRRRRNLTQQQLADAAGLTSRFISMVETGRRRPSIPSLLRLRDVLGF